MLKTRLHGQNLLSVAAASQLDLRKQKKQFGVIILANTSSISSVFTPFELHYLLSILLTHLHKGFCCTKWGKIISHLL